MTKSSHTGVRGGPSRDRHTAEGRTSHRDWLKSGLLSAGVTVAVVWWVAPIRAAQQTHLDNLLRARSAAVLTYEQRDRDLQQAEAKVAADLATISPHSPTLTLDQVRLIEADSALSQARLLVSRSGTAALEALTQQLRTDHEDLIAFLHQASGSSTGWTDPANFERVTQLRSEIESDFAEFVAQAWKSL